jgi:hypothetical protein
MSESSFEPPASAHPKIVRLHDYWRRAAPGPGLLPGRQHIDPTDFPPLLPNVWLLDVVPSGEGKPPRFRFRLIGTAIVRAGLRAKPGDFLEDTIDRAREKSPAANDAKRVVAERQPNWYRGEPLTNHDREVVELERLLLPLAANGVDIDMLLCLTVFYTSAGKAI